MKFGETMFPKVIFHKETSNAQQIKSSIQIDQIWFLWQEQELDTRNLNANLGPLK